MIDTIELATWPELSANGWRSSISWIFRSKILLCLFTMFVFLLLEFVWYMFWSLYWSCLFLFLRDTLNTHMLLIVRPHKQKSIQMRFYCMDRKFERIKIKIRSELNWTELLYCSPTNKRYEMSLKYQCLCLFWNMIYIYTYMYMFFMCVDI